MVLLLSSSLPLLLRPVLNYVGPHKYDLPLLLELLLRSHSLLDLHLTSEKLPKRLPNPHRLR